MKIPATPVNAEAWDAAIADLIAGKITRKEAAERVGLKYDTFLKRTRYTGIQKALRQVVDHANSGENSRAAKEDPDRFARYKAAVAEVVAGRKCSEVARRYELNYQVLFRKVKAAKAPPIDA